MEELSTWIGKQWARIQAACGNCPNRPKKRPQRLIRAVSANRSVKTAGNHLATNLQASSKAESGHQRPKLRQNAKPGLQSRILQRIQRSPATARQIAKSLHAKQSRIGHHLQMLLRDGKAWRTNQGEYTYHAGTAD